MRLCILAYPYQVSELGQIATGLVEHTYQVSELGQIATGMVEHNEQEIQVATVELATVIRRTIQAQYLN